MNAKDTQTNKEIYFHVGLGKVASKYLQYKIFPQFENIYYIPTTKYHKYFKIIEKTKYMRYLLSREFDQQLEREVKKVSEKYPGTKSILILRRHDSWIASQYRRFAKNGFNKSFTHFIDIENDTGRFKKEDLNFYGKIRILEKYFTEKPLVLFYDNLMNNPVDFIDTIAKFTHAAYDKNKISLEKKHTSYEEKQIKVMQAVSRMIPIREKTYTSTGIAKFFQRLPDLFIRYTILYGALLIPKAFISKEKLIPENALKKIRTLTKDDWEKCLEYARKNNPVP